MHGQSELIIYIYFRPFLKFIWLIGINLSQFMGKSSWAKMLNLMPLFHQRIKPRFVQGPLILEIR